MKKNNNEHEKDGSYIMNKKKAIISFITLVIFIIGVVVQFTNVTVGENSKLLSNVNLTDKIKGTFNNSEVSKALGLKVVKENDSEKVSTSTISPNSKIDGVKVLKVVDGDTIKVLINGVNEKVRLISVDTPESVHPNSKKNTKEGKIASNYTKEKLEDKTISLEFDVQTRDRYGRLLAYVYLDGKSYNEMLLNDGMATAVSFSPNVKNYDKYKKLEKAAKIKGVGIWKK